MNKELYSIYCEYLLNLVRTPVMGFNPLKVYTSYSVLENLLKLMDKIDNNSIREIIDIEYKNIYSINEFYELGMDLKDFNEFARKFRKKKLNKLNGL